MNGLSDFKQPKIFDNGTKKEFGTFPSADKKHEINYVVYTPKEPPHAILQMIHGMNGTIAQYEDFALFLAENGIMFCGAELIGHGINITSKEDMWYFGSGASDKFLTADTASMTSVIRKKYRRLPLVLCGHSLGSFIARDYVTVPEYTELVDGAVFEGTSGEIPTKFQKLYCKAICCFKGEKSVNKRFNDAFFDRLREKTKSEGPNAWACSNNEFIKIADSLDPQPYFTSKGFLDMFNILLKINDPAWAESVPKNLPLLIISGEDDPVGEYGEGVRRIYENLDNAEICNLKMKLYKNMRHELLCETDRAEVFRDILDWIDSVAEGKVMSQSFTGIN